MAAEATRPWRFPVPPPPRTLDVRKFAESRSAELESLHSIISNRLKNDYRSRRNKRRRTTGFDKNRRRRKRPREGETEERDRKLPRRVRRRIEMKMNEESGFSRSGDGSKRLRTHVWHAKRFTMVKRWGFYLPLGLHGRGRGSRAVLKWFREGAVLHDASYRTAVQLEGKEEILVSILIMVLEPSPFEHSEDIFKCLLSGDMYASAMLYHPEEPVRRAIGPVTYMWRPLHQHDDGTVTEHINNDGNSEKRRNVCHSAPRRLWIWMSSAFLPEGLDALNLARQKKMDESGDSVDIFSLEGKLAKFEVMGSGAFELVQKMLHPVSSCLEDPTAEVENQHELNPQQVLHKDCFSSQAVVSLTVSDPRSSSGTRIAAAAEENLGEDMDDDTKQRPGLTNDVLLSESTLQSKEKGDFFSNCKDLWDASKGINPPVEENVLCMERHHKSMDYFCLKDINSGTSASINSLCSGYCPVMLLKNAKHGVPRGWSIILPLSWAKAFWIPLVSKGARAIGLREKHWICCDVGLPDFPSDFPDTSSYSYFMAEEAMAADKKRELRPPSMRPFRVPIPPPWNRVIFTFDKDSPQVKDTCSSINTVGNGERLENSNRETKDLPALCHDRASEVFVARTSKMLSCFLNEISCNNLLLCPCVNDGKSFTQVMKDEAKISQASVAAELITQERRLCYLRVLLRAYKEGVFEEGAVVHAPRFSDISLWTSRSVENEAGFHIPRSCVSSYFREQTSGGWDFLLPEDPIARESYRRPIGFVTTGFVQGSKKPVAVAFCEALLVASLRQEQWRQVPARKRKKEVFVLVRNLRSTAYRLALATVVLEVQPQDVESL